MEFERYLLKTLLNHLLPNKVNLIFGTRRVGKTYLLKQLTARTAYRTLTLQGEDYDTQQLLAQRSIANYRRLLDGVELLIVDEAQEITDIGLILKLIVDQIEPLRIVVTGSSAFDLANLSGEPLTGRAYFHQLYPLAQCELAPYENSLETRQRLDDRLVLGSYPELLQLSGTADRQEYLKNLVNTYLLKDILAFEGVRNAAKVKDLLRLVAFQVGKEVSMDELGRQLQSSKNTVEKYLDMFTKVFVLVRVGGFSRNLRKEVTKTSRWYFTDAGIRNALINDFRLPALRTDAGALWENYLIAERLKILQAQRRPVEFFFWRTYDQQEIDWLELENGQLRAYEFKWSDNRATITRTKVPKAFADAYPDATFTAIHRDNYLEFIGG
ncbi:ATP-binding protein [Nibrella viscosa]|uniref:ATP-binding protein n=1 Tax=Nibrella viscosa TaxID=1084524 RepID=A0ABP8KYR7_9BACT